MAGFLSRNWSKAKNTDVRRRPRGGLHYLMEKGEYLGASYLAARVNTQYGEKAKWRDMEITYLAGLAGMVGTFAAEFLGYGGLVGSLAPHIDAVSTALVATHLAARGAQDGIEAAHGLPAAAVAPVLPSAARQTVSGSQVLGAIPPAPQPGKFLSLDEVNRIASMHG